jgi:hypothetical protein
MTVEHSQRVIHPCVCPTCQQHPYSALAREHLRINRLLAAADERMRRLMAGFLAKQHGKGGVSLLAQITGLDRNTVARGQRELRRSHPKMPDWIRRPGAGRPCAEKKLLKS